MEEVNSSLAKNKLRITTIVCLLFILFGMFTGEVKGQNYSPEKEDVRVGPPKPPLGKRWVMNPDFSDEFNGTELDTTKWLDHHPTWIGREPGLFMKSQVSVADGYLQLKGEKMAKDTVIKAYGKEMTFSIAGAAVVSKKKTQFGYFETRVKAAATTMSTTFWFSTVGSFKGPNDCDAYGLEWDIHESVGRTGDFSGDYFASGMHSNSHFWYTDCGGERHDRRAAQVRFEDDEVTSENFHVYGGWWRNESTASYYYDHREPKHQKFYDKVKEKPFDQPMYMRLVSETYPFPWIALPDEEELSNPRKNVVYYDWVRAYTLEDISKEVAYQPLEKQLQLYEESVIFDTVAITVKNTSNIEIPISYKANKSRQLVLEIYDNDDKKIATDKVKLLPGYGHFRHNLQLENTLHMGGEYRLLAKLQPINEEDKTILDRNNLILKFK
ncbi:family 16 glycosylhydrolase [Maribacter litoralis]|uniref:Beta-porphyranase D n=1 Tax=Maribacter litoralis TaxID=2059726 RepID=A0A653M6C2_9FLAO|nr:family 16 glycosylhydrolase [Maribacter litoralis]VXA99576.1 Beta-porphyranase D [Maribacter litoralis]